MKIIVCTKQIRYTYARTGKNPDMKYINPEDSIFRVNPYDEAATELALRLRDTVGNVEISLLTLGDMIAEYQLRRCLAAGPDHLFQADFNGHKNPDPLSQPDPWVKADLIARAAKSIGADLILCGKESMDRASGQVGALIAQQLDLPFVSAITDLSFDRETNKAEVQRSAGRGVREFIECALPAVFSVDLGPDLRLPTVEARKKADAYKIRTPDVGTETIHAKITCKDIFQPRPRPKIIPAPDSSLNAFDRILQLLAGSKVEKKGEMLTGSTQSQVEGIINFLKENKFIESEKAI
ncbi:Electron transfer flavoprotein subunit beta N-terminal domain-containing protein [Desulfonema limicola]|uniref:Electron transfer flavoprotein subunit beta N-terminal domain-containing protein n=1 Tax=Desulfonema limicola TaxID=45656 RepID=A0A975B9L0_9BACT|nr:hypothetical protein [Desulfonema limicola]QTA81451.1 Electron transfer flavoprotein subunit beta N-terminal domain-containing protein [Desulfonema limicola]